MFWKRKTKAIDWSGQPPCDTRPWSPSRKGHIVTRHIEPGRGSYKGEIRFQPHHDGWEARILSTTGLHWHVHEWTTSPKSEAQAREWVDQHLGLIAARDAGWEPA